MTDASRTHPSGSHPGGAWGVAGTGTGPRLGRLVVRWWPALLGLALGILSLITVEPWQPSEPTTAILPGLAIAYLVFGAVRRQLRRPGVLRLEVVGLVVFGGCALVAVLVDPEVGHYVAGAGWIGHAAWDVAHHRDLSDHHAVGVVPRGYAEFCIGLDLLVGAALIVAPAA